MDSSHEIYSYRMNFRFEKVIYMSSGFNCLLGNKMFALGKLELQYGVAAGTTILEPVNILHAGVITVGVTFLRLFVPFQTTLRLIIRWLLKHELKALQIIMKSLTEKDKK